jgi:putative SOS response-associated peptidase YedK
LSQRIGLSNINKERGDMNASRSYSAVISNWLPVARIIVESDGFRSRARARDGINVRDSSVYNYPPRWNAAPSQDLLVIRRNHETGELSLDPLRWGLIPHWCQDPNGGPRPINAKCETVHALPMFREGYHRRHCIVPVDEWKAIKGQKAKQPYAIAMKDGTPFGTGGIWENWKEPFSGEWIRTFAVIATDAALGSLCLTGKVDV